MGSRCKINTASSGLRIRFTSMPIRIPLFPLMPIRIRLFNSMRIRILLLIKVMLICDHGSTDLPWAPFWASTPPLLASPTFHCYVLSLESSWILTFRDSQGLYNYNPHHQDPLLPVLVRQWGMKHFFTRQYRTLIAKCRLKLIHVMRLVIE